MRKFLLLFLSVGIIRVSAQNTIGMPEVISFPKDLYRAGTQNWKIAQDKNGIMYFANNEGLLTFDGNFWKKYTVPNGTIVRSLAIVQNRIYIGAQSEIGYFSSGTNGVLKYTSLTEKIPDNDRGFADVWDVIPYGDKVFFRSNKKVIQFDNGAIKIFSGIDWSFLGLSNGELIANEYQKGILKYSSGKWMPFLEKNDLPGDARITSITSIAPDSSIVTTLTSGLYLLTGNTLVPFAHHSLSELSGKNIYKSVFLGDDHIAIITNFGGCYIISKKGKIVKWISKQDGLLNNNVLSAFLDRDKNLWLGLDNGINLIVFDNAISHIYPDNEEQSTGYAAMIYNNSLYLGTSNGLYSIAISGQKDFSQIRNKFHLVPGTSGQVWNLSEVDGKLLMGHNVGFFQIEDDRAKMIDPTSGFWTFLPVGDYLPSKLIIAGNYNGINLYYYRHGQFTNPSIHTHFESARFVALNEHIAWVAHPYKGVYKVNLTNESAPTNIIYPDKNHYLTRNNNYIFKVKGRVVLCTGKGIFEYNSRKDDFVPSEFFNQIMKGIPVQYFKEDEEGNVWFVSDKRPGLIDFSAKKPTIIFIPELNDKIMSNEYKFIYPYNQENVFIAGEKGFYHLNLKKYKERKRDLSVLLSSVNAVSNHDSTIFGNFLTDFSKAKRYANPEIPKLNHHWNSIRFSFSSPEFAKQSQIEYSYMLENFDDSWSVWSPKNEKEYTNLSEGTYTFRVKAGVQGVEESPVYSYRFSIMPPWYRSLPAYIFYFLSFVGIMVFFYYLQKRRFRLQSLKYEEEQKRLIYLNQLERDRDEKEIIRLKNEKLEADIQLKNTELASATFSLVQNGERLLKVKEELLKLKVAGTSEKNSQEYKKIIRMLGESTIKESWEEFALHFDQVHNNFLVKIKNSYPKLTPNELKLCAYLRLNLSSKEIGQIMNITTKSVELARYRLRKKLKIQQDVELFSFLLKINE